MSKGKKEDIRDVIKRSAVSELGAAFSASMESLKGVSVFDKPEEALPKVSPEPLPTSPEAILTVKGKAEPETIAQTDIPEMHHPLEKVAKNQQEHIHTLDVPENEETFKLPENISDERLISMLSRIISKPELIVALLNILGAEDVSPAGKVIMMSLLLRGGGSTMNLPFGKFCESIGVSAHIHRNWSSGKYSHPWLVVNGVGSYNDGKEVHLHESVFHSEQRTFSFLDEVKLVERTLERDVELPCSPLEMYASFPPVVSRAVECALLLCAEGAFEPEMLTLPVLAWFVERDPETGEFLHSREEILVRWMTLCERRYEWKKGTNTDIMTKRLLSLRDESIGKHLIPIAERFVNEKIWNFMLGEREGAEAPSPELLVRWRNNRKETDAWHNIEDILQQFTEYSIKTSEKTMKRIASCVSNNEPEVK